MLSPEFSPKFSLPLAANLYSARQGTEFNFTVERREYEIPCMAVEYRNLSMRRDGA